MSLVNIQNPQTGEFVPLIGAFNPEPGRPPLAGTLSFKIDYRKGGEGQEVLEEHFRSGLPGRVEHNGRQYEGPFKDLDGFNTEDGTVVVGLV